MADTTQVDYDQLLGFAQMFAAEAEEYQALNQRTRNYVEDLHGKGWIGRGSDAFFEEMQGEVLPAMERVTKALREAGQITQAIAEIFNAAEEEAQGNFTSIGE
jgi:WXG100 family type VII secretion target